MNKATERILEAGRKVWESFMDHPFVMGLADGTLDKDKFEFFMIQDYLYLLEYAKVFAIGMAKCNDPEVCRFFYNYVNSIYGGELKIHRSYMQRLGITTEQAEQAKMALDNVSYTSYMLKEAYEGGPAEVLAAVLPCSISYEEIATMMVAKDPACAEHPFYGEWVSGYACDEYKAGNVAMLEMTDRVTEGMSDVQIDHLVEIAERCCRYEGAFWEMSWRKRV